MSAATSTREYGPWNPGISSALPREYLPLSTMFRVENVSTGVEEAEELSDFCGFAAHELVAFRAERLVVHELLIRVMADLTVPDGPNYEDLGISFRKIAATILSNHIAPNFPELNGIHEELNRAAWARIESELSSELFSVPRRTESKTGRERLFGIFGRGNKPSGRAVAAESHETRVHRVLDKWAGRSNEADTPFEKACLDALIKIVAAVACKHGRLVADRPLITRLATNFVCNGYGSELLGQAIDPYFQEAVSREGYRLLRARTNPSS